MSAALVKKTLHQVLAELPRTPVPTTVLPSAHELGILWSSVLTLGFSQAWPLFSDPVVRVAIVRMRSSTFALQHALEEETARTGRVDFTLIRNLWEAVVQALVTRKSEHQRMAVLALQQVLIAQAAGAAAITAEQRAYLHNLTGVRCAESIPIAAMQAARAYGEATTGRIMPWQYLTLPDGVEFLVEPEEAVVDGNVDDDITVRELVDVPAKPSPHRSLADIRVGLQGRVIGQENAVKDFAACAYRHLHGVRQGAILITGMTGVGKTSLATTWGAMSNRPVIFMDCATLVPEGIRGGSISDGIVNLWKEADKDLDKASRGVLFFDEFDKLSGSQFSVQVRNELLVLLDGGIWRSFDPEKIDKGARLDAFPTVNLMIVLCGSFTEQREERQRHVGFHGIGGSLGASPSMNLDELLPLADLRGRIACRIDLQPLDCTALRSILVGEHGPLCGLRALFPGWVLKLSEHLVDRIVTSALESNLGVRGLWPLVRDLETRLLYDPPTQPGEHLGVQFGWEMQTLSDRLPPSVRKVIEMHREETKAVMNASS